MRCHAHGRLPGRPDRAARRAILLALLLVLPGCAREPALFRLDNARVHVGMLAGTIGSRPIGTPGNARARAYIVEQLKDYGFDVRVQETDGRRPEYGLTARVANIIATLPGQRSEAIGIVAHYDSSPFAPGAADDGLGVAVALEAARVLSARKDRQWSLMILVTDGEEAGLMGAAALVTDREVERRLQAYLLVEATGNAGPAVLFETGPGNGWLVSSWAAHASSPRGGSFAIDIYRRLPNDTDFTILKRTGVPGLNFAPTGDSYAYHTALDTPERLSDDTLRTTGENIVGIAGALDTTDITRRSSTEPTFFDIASTSAVTYGAVAWWLLAAGALVLGVLAWVRTTSAVIRTSGLLRWIVTLLWTWVGAAVVVAAMVGITWGLREAREVYHPWYAAPRRLFAAMAIAGFVAGWGMTRLGAWLPARIRGHRDPVATWSVALPAWIALAAGALWVSPGGAYLCVIPLAVAGLCLALIPPHRTLALRAASLVVFAVSATLWLPNLIALLDFMVPLFGRFPIITPAFVYAALMALAAVMVVPPFVGTFIASRRLVRPSLATSLALIALVVAAGLAYAAPAYTPERPLRRMVRVVQLDGSPTATWEVASVEPGLDLAPAAPAPWEAAREDGPWPWSRLPYPFVFRHVGTAIGPAPADVLAPVLQPVPGGLDLRVTVVPKVPGLAVTFALPPGLTPARHNLPGRVRQDAWTATYLAPPPDGVLFQASFNTTDPALIRQIRVAVSSDRLPGGTGWQQLPPWLPRELTVWSAQATWVIQPPFADGEPLR